MTTDKKEKNIVLLYELFDHSIGRDIDKTIIIGTFEINIVKDLNISISELPYISIDSISDKIINYAAARLRFGSGSLEIKSGLCGTNKKYIKYTKIIDNEIRIHYMTIGNIRKRDF